MSSHIRYVIDKSLVNDQKDDSSMDKKGCAGWFAGLIRVEKNSGGSPGLVLENNSDSMVQSPHPSTSSGVCKDLLCASKAFFGLLDTCFCNSHHTGQYEEVAPTDSLQDVDFWGQRTDLSHGTSLSAKGSVRHTQVLDTAWVSEVQSTEHVLLEEQLMKPALRIPWTLSSFWTTHPKGGQPWD